MTGFGLDHLPYGVASHQGRDLVVVRLGDDVVDLAALAAASPPGFDASVLAGSSLAPLMAAGPEVWAVVRSWLQDTLPDAPASHIPLAEVEMRMPFAVADYVDFYASLNHASNVGKIFRPDAEPLLPNWRHLPVGYHGRAGTVVPSGTPIVRPRGQRRPGPDGRPGFGPSQALDIEAELGFVVGAPSAMGQPVPTGAFADHVFGVTLLNDWSARDIQAWEYVPLGPFLGKSFATSISPWITPLAALDDARAPLPGQDPEPLDYLQVAEPAGLAIELEVVVNDTVVSRPPYASMYWSPAQMLAHMTVNGASLRTGDLYGSGTISGVERDQRGSLLELSWGGSEPFTLDDGTTRTYLLDGDTVILRATAGSITLGEVEGTITA
ncbi:fumarylacetoacetase [Aeromicrobium sp. Root236]|uniref:fumarylacetoacetase n=1 Tax=Aeromicrobium sp. Root236 TaxID=1736498 RepID=UPI0006FD083C|nr:fumarylacetoacetase [Aeromicrobium sp. Root236]KRC66145.1 fumarylacetoacetase [Aeromicrobium sp. Root236]